MDLVKVFTDGLNAAIGPIAALYAMAAIGLNMHFGYTGLLNFGQVGFMLVGAYGLAISVAIFQLPFWVGILVAFLAAALLALLLGIPTLRLRADYLAITTIAAAEILRFLFRAGPATEVTGGVFGIPSQISDARGFADPLYNLSPFAAGTYGIGDVSFRANRLWMTIVAWLLVALVAGAVALLVNSPWGRVVRSIREDEDAARSLGKNVFAYKMQSLMLGGVLGGLAGILFGLNQQALSPDNFLPQITFFAYAVLILGGAATVLGPILGSVVFWFLIVATDSFMRQLDVDFDVGAARLALVGLGLMLLMAFRPQGIMGDKREMMLDA